MAGVLPLPKFKKWIYMKIIAYGSLLNVKSMAITFEELKTLRKINLPGFGRIFNAPFGQYSYLNLREGKNLQIEAAYFEVDNNQLKILKKREAGAELVEVMPGFFAFIWRGKYCKKKPVLASYIKVCEDGAQNLGVNFWEGTIKPLKIVNDLKKSLYENYAE